MISKDEPITATLINKLEADIALLKAELAQLKLEIYILKTPVPSDKWCPTCMTWYWSGMVHTCVSKFCPNCGQSYYGMLHTCQYHSDIANYCAQCGQTYYGTIHTCTPQWTNTITNTTNKLLVAPLFPKVAVGGTGGGSAYSWTAEIGMWSKKEEPPELEILLDD